MNNHKKEWLCPACGHKNRKDACYCGFCGTARPVAAAVEKPGKPRKSPLPLILAVVLLLGAGVLWTFAAHVGVSSKGKSGSGTSLAIADIVPYPAQYGEALGLIALYSDGTVQTKGLESDFKAEAIRRIEAWNQIEQIVTYPGGVMGLRRDGSVAYESLFRPSTWPTGASDPTTWEKVRSLCSDGHEAFGLTKDGRVLIPWDTDLGGFDGAVTDYLSWTDVRELCPYAYPEERGVIGLRSDGSICQTKSYSFYRFSEVPEKAKQLSSSGYLTVCLQGNGMATVCGMYAGEISQKLEKLNNIAQVEAREHGVVCRLKDGSVCYVHSNGAEDGISNAVEQWRDVTDVQAAGPLVLGLTRAGKVLLAMESRDNSYYDKTQLAEIRQKLSSWDGIVKYKAYQSYGYLYVLGWQKDGKILAAGIDLAWVS